MRIKNIVKKSLGYIIRKRARNVYIKYYSPILIEMQHFDLRQSFAGLSVEMKDTINKEHNV